MNTEVMMISGGEERSGWGYDYMAAVSGERGIRMGSAQITYFAA